MRCLVMVVLAAICAAAPLSAQVPADATAPPALRLGFAGDPVLVWSHALDACDGDDVPDANLRAFRTDSGIVAFGMHDVNRALRGPSLDRLRLDCRVVLPSHGDSDPAHYDDHNWITATWSRDGRTIDAIVHHEYHASEHADRCRVRDFMACWYNTLTAARSTDGGLTFARIPGDSVVASAPFRQDVDQTRHRGFFNPSNIVSDGEAFYMLAGTTGWRGQPYGVCLFRTRTPDDPTSWLAYDGTGFTRRFGDPYGSTPLADAPPCRPIAPFPTPVGAIVRHAASGLWLAIVQAKGDGRDFPLSGLYYATSRDLIRWSAPRLLVAGPTLYDDPCASGGRLINYPSLLDPNAPDRNFMQTGDTPELFYVTLAVENCRVTSRRDLWRRPLTITPSP